MLVQVFLNWDNIWLWKCLCHLRPFVTSMSCGEVYFLHFYTSASFFDEVRLYRAKAHHLCVIKGTGSNPSRRHQATQMQNYWDQFMQIYPPVRAWIFEVFSSVCVIHSALVWSIQQEYCWGQGFWSCRQMSGEGKTVTKLIPKVWSYSTDTSKPESFFSQLSETFLEQKHL